MHDSFLLTIAAFIDLHTYIRGIHILRAPGTYELREVVDVPCVCCAP